MSAQVKSRAKKAGKIAGIALFVFFMFFSIKFSVGDYSNGDIDLFGLKVSVITPSTYASSSYCYYWSTYWNDCVWPEINCMCDVGPIYP
jgi:hypothetical protein